MFGRKRAGYGQDKASRELQESGVYTLGQGPHPYMVDNGTVEAVKSRKIHSFWSGVWYATVLSALLFWLPPFGQMIAGYVGGRKAGTPLKGLMAAFAPMSFIFLLFLMRLMGVFVPEIEWLMGIPYAGAYAVTAKVPVLGPLFGFMFNYTRTFVSTLWSHEFFIYPYVLTVIFGYIGGILSLQRRREMEADGNGHPFVPMMLVTQQPGALPVAGDRETREPEVVMGKIPKGWKMKKDGKKGRW